MFNESANKVSRIDSILLIGKHLISASIMRSLGDIEGCESEEMAAESVAYFDGLDSLPNDAGNTAPAYLKVYPELERSWNKGRSDRINPIGPEFEGSKLVNLVTEKDTGLYLVKVDDYVDEGGDIHPDFVWGERSDALELRIERYQGQTPAECLVFGGMEDHTKILTVKESNQLKSYGYAR